MEKACSSPVFGTCDRTSRSAGLMVLPGTVLWCWVIVSLIRCPRYLGGECVMLFWRRSMVYHPAVHHAHRSYNFVYGLQACSWFLILAEQWQFLMDADHEWIALNIPTRALPKPCASLSWKASARQPLIFRPSPPKPRRSPSVLVAVRIPMEAPPRVKLNRRLSMAFWHRLGLPAICVALLYRFFLQGSGTLETAGSLGIGTGELGCMVV